MDHLLSERTLVTVVLVFFANRVRNAEAVNATYPALFAFGDSILDTGNNNGLGTFSKCNFPPYGGDFGEPTGRFCNGKIPTDLIAGDLGIKQTVPAYLSDNLSVDDLLTGVSFASGGSGNDNLTATTLQVLTLSDQLQNFKDYIQKLNASVGPQKAASIVSNGLYLFSAGNNDIALTYTLNFAGSTSQNFTSYADSLVGWGSNFLNNLYQLGARHVWVLSTLPLGCLPGPRSVKGGLFRVCSNDINDEAQFFNTKLKEEVSTLKNQPNLPNFDVTFIDVYNPMMNLIQNPSSQGFTNIDSGCCGTGLLETALLCNALSVLCQNTSEYLFWDSAHPTQRAYELIVDDILKANNIPRFLADSRANST
ncbi:GDSL esterase/lipase At5g42170-like [Lotus japonicus]|uniref:GDSL esterase/lipase At5g42170-like n=1 Tax=Lotus japonicus TaxID=34305 RepID=UPI0025840123|nr:GDSL esterase/lipase At5g42170-like [Lotus japonicus]